MCGRQRRGAPGTVSEQMFCQFIRNTRRVHLIFSHVELPEPFDKCPRQWNLPLPSHREKISIAAWMTCRHKGKHGHGSNETNPRLSVPREADPPPPLPWTLILVPAAPSQSFSSMACVPATDSPGAAGFSDCPSWPTVATRFLPGRCGICPASPMNGVSLPPATTLAGPRRQSCPIGGYDGNITGPRSAHRCAWNYE